MANDTKVYMGNKSFTVSQAAKFISANGANYISPKGVDDSGIMVRFVARNYASFEDIVFGMCQISDFAKINEALRPGCV